MRKDIRHGNIPEDLLLDSIGARLILHPSSHTTLYSSVQYATGVILSRTLTYPFLLLYHVRVHHISCNVCRRDVLVRAEKTSM
jgi:hypothetical protein